MSIHQLSVTYDEQQDRLLLRINTQSAEEYRIWLTRRLTQRLMPIVEKTVIQLESMQAGVVATDDTGRKIVAELRRDAFMQKADFQTPFSPQAQTLPLGEVPMLVTDAQLSLLPQRELRMLLQDKTGPQLRQCQIQLPAHLVHGLLHLTQQAILHAGWNLAATAASEQAEPASPAPAAGYAH